MARRSNVVTLFASANDLKILLQEVADIYTFELVWVPGLLPTSNSNLVPANQFVASVKGIFAVQPTFSASTAIAEMNVKNSQMCAHFAPVFLRHPKTQTFLFRFPAGVAIPSECLYAFDSAMLWASSLASASNTSNSAVISVFRSLTVVASNLLAGIARFRIDGARIGDVDIVNYRNSAAPIVASKWTGVVRLNFLFSPFGASYFIRIQASSAGSLLGRTANLTFSSSAAVPLTSTHNPVFLIGLLWSANATEAAIWLQAARLAVTQMNRANFIPGWDLRATFYDDQRSVSTHVTGAISLLGKGVRAMIGGTSSSLSIASQNVLKPYGIPFLSGSSTSDALSSKSSYPSFYRTIAPDRLQSRLLAEVARRFNWTYICTVNYENDYSSNLISRFASEFLSASSANRVFRATYSASNPSVESPIKSMLNAKCRIIYAVPDNDNFGLIFAEAKKQGLLGPGIQWVMPESVFQEMNPTVMVSKHKLDPADLFGTMLVSQLAGKESDPLFQSFKTDLAAARGVADKSLLDNYITYFWDAVWALGYTARKFALSSSPAQMLNTTAFSQALVSTRFNGATGNVSFDENGDRVGMPYGVFNYLNRSSVFSLVQVGIWEGASVYINTSAILFADGSNNFPLDTIPVPTSAVLFSWGGVAVITALAAVIILLLVITMIMVFVYRDNNLIYRSSPTFLGITLTGLLLTTVSIFFWFGDASTIKCHLRVWFGFVGFAIAYGALLAKNARLWYLFNEPSLRIIAITNKQLFFYLMLLVGPQAIVLILWSSLAPFAISPVSNASGSLNYLLCTSRNDYIFAPISLAYMGLLLFVGGFLSFKTRTLPDIFRESSYIAIATYNYIFVATVCVIIAFAIATEPLAGLTVATVGILFGGCMNWVLLFIPKFYLIIFKPEVVAAMSNTASRTRRTGGSGTVGSDKNSVSMGSISTAAHASASRKHDSVAN